MDDILMGDCAMDVLLDDEAQEVCDAAEDALYDDYGEDIDAIADITDEDVDECDYDPEDESEYYENVDPIESDDNNDDFIDYQLDDE